jgi:hypothetical protein
MQLCIINWAAVATFTAAFVALFRDEIRAIWSKPRFAVLAKLASPHCHLSELTRRDKSGTVVWRQPCYYLRLWIENEGRSAAEGVQVFVAKLLREHADNEFREESAFLPMNLKWSHTGEVFAKRIAAGMGRHCDLVSIVHPAGKAEAGFELPSGPTKGVIGRLELEAVPNTRSDLLKPGNYRLVLKVASSNTKPNVVTIQLKIKGGWADTEAAMFADNLAFTLVQQ